MVQGALIQRNQTGRSSRVGQAELPACCLCSQAGQPCRALPGEEFWAVAGQGRCSASLSAAVPLAPFPAPFLFTGSHLPGKAITFHFRFPKKVEPVFPLTEVPLTCPGHLSALSQVALLPLLLQPSLGQTVSPARTLSHLLCSPLFISSHSLLFPPLYPPGCSLHPSSTLPIPPSSTHSRNWSACSPTPTPSLESTNPISQPTH